MGAPVDVVVVGCGAAGLAVAAELARRGRSVVGLDRFEFGHSRGSSHGGERIVRVAYADAVHAEMAVRSLDGWRRLERDAGSSLLTATGGLDIGGAAEIDLLATQCESVGVPVARFTLTEANRRFPMFRFGTGDAAGDASTVVMSHAASTVNAEQALVALRNTAERAGATFVAGARVEAIDVVDDGTVLVRHTGGTTGAASCVVTVGAWADDPLVAAALGDAAVPELVVTQEQVGYFRPLAPGDWPTFVDRSEPCIYGLPSPDGLVKIGEHHTGRVIDADSKSDEVDPETWERLRSWVTLHAPGVEPAAVRSATCLYASYPGDTFLFDRVGPVVVGLGLSGHGFKFVPEIGRRLADLVDRHHDPDNPFGFDRPALDVGASGRR